MDDVAKANFLKMQGRFSAMEVAIRAVIARSDEPAAIAAEIRLKVEGTLKVLSSSDRTDLLLVADSMRQTMEALLDTN